MQVEHEYERRGAWAYLAAWDVHRAKVFGRCEPTTGIAPFDRLVDQVMSQAPYDQARTRVLDRGQRLFPSRRSNASSACKRATPGSFRSTAPVHASWLNQIEIYFSIVQRKVLTPNDFSGLDAVEQRLWTSNATTKASHARSSGSSRAPISTLC